VDADGERRARFEPWPWALALALAAMIGGSLAFLAIATLHPDPVVERHPAAETPAESPRAAR